MKDLLLWAGLVTVVVGLPQVYNQGQVPQQFGNQCRCRDVICPNTGVARCQCLNKAAQDCYTASRGACPPPTAQNCNAQQQVGYPYQQQQQQPRPFIGGNPNSYTQVFTNYPQQPQYQPQPQYNPQPQYPNNPYTVPSNGYPQQPQYQQPQPQYQPQQQYQPAGLPPQPQQPYSGRPYNQPRPTYRPNPQYPNNNVGGQFQTVTVTYNPQGVQPTIQTITISGSPPAGGYQQPPYQQPRPTYRPRPSRPPYQPVPSQATVTTVVTSYYTPPYNPPTPTYNPPQQQQPQQSQAPYVPPWAQTTSKPYLPPWATPPAPPAGFTPTAQQPTTNAPPPWQPRTSDGPAWTPVPGANLPDQPSNPGPLPTPTPDPAPSPQPTPDAQPSPSPSPSPTQDTPSPAPAPTPTPDPSPSPSASASPSPAKPSPDTSGKVKCGPGLPACENDTYCDPQPLCSIGQDCPGVCLPILDAGFSVPTKMRMAIWQDLLDSGEWSMYKFTTGTNSTVAVAY